MRERTGERPAERSTSVSLSQSRSEPDERKRGRLGWRLVEVKGGREINIRKYVFESYTHL